MGITRMSKLNIALVLLVVFAVSIQASQTCQEKCAGNDLFINEKMCVRNCRTNERLPSDRKGRAGGEGVFDADVYMDNANKAFEECKNTAFKTHGVRNHLCRCVRRSKTEYDCKVRSSKAEKGAFRMTVNRPFGAKMKINSFA